MFYFIINWWMLLLPIHADVVTALYITTISAGYICLLMGGLWMSRLLKHHLMEDVFNNENESFQQETRLMDSLIPASKISSLTQGMFVGAVSDNFDERIDQKIFHAEIVVDNAKVARETKAYKPIPIITDFTDENGNDHMEETVAANYFRIKEDVKQIVSEELERIRNNPTLAHLLQQK